MRIEVDGKEVNGIFDRPGDPLEGVPGTNPAADAPYMRDVGWVRRSDTGELVALPYERIRPASSDGS